jgi:signal transduction histidine kinase
VRVRALFVAATVLPAGALVWLGWRLASQERALEEQRRRDRLEAAADATVASLQAAVARAEQETPPAAGTVRIVFRASDVEVRPSDALLYRPRLNPAQEAPPVLFEEGEQAEFGREDLDRALAAYSRQARSGNPQVRTAAMFRCARVLRKRKNYEEALAIYARLLNESGGWWQGAPAPLAARHARCGLLPDPRAEAVRLREELESGRYELGPAVYLLYARDAAAWLGENERRQPERLALSEAAMELWGRWRHSRESFRRGSGREVLWTDSQPVTVLWRAAAEGFTATLAPQSFAPFRPGQRIQLRDAEGKVAAGVTLPPGTMPAHRNAADTLLPWTVVAWAVDQDTEPSAAHYLIGGFALLVAAVLAAAYFTYRAVSRELAVAQIQSDFVAAVSHEFRTPLTSLSQFTEMLEEQQDLSDADRRVCYAAQARATRRLARLVESLLDFGRMEAGARPYRLEVQEAEPLVRKILDEFRAENPAAQIVFDPVVANGRVEADAGALTLALWNLLDNAVKYSPEGSRIEVKLERRGPKVAVAVRDQGVGLPARERERIFTKFFRGAEARRLDIKGTGIGLALVRHIAGAHGGRIEVESTEGAGSTFTLLLPARE